MTHTILHLKGEKALFLDNARRQDTKTMLLDNTIEYLITYSFIFSAKCFSKFQSKYHPYQAMLKFREEQSHNQCFNMSDQLHMSFH